MKTSQRRLQPLFSLASIGVLLLAETLPASAQEITFTQAFAPSEGMVTPFEQPFRAELCLNGKWKFQPVVVPPDFKPGSGTAPELPLPRPGGWETVPIKIPSPWNVNTWGNGRDAGAGTKRPYVADSVYYPSYPASWDGVRMGWLQRSFRTQSDWKGRRIILHFEAVAGEARVFVNGKPAGPAHFDNFLPFEYDVTGLVNPEGENELRVGVRKSELFNVESPGYPSGQRRTYPNGSNTDNLAGIWNDVYLWALPSVRTTDVFVQPQLDKDTLRADVTLRNDTDQPRRVSVAGSASPWVNEAGKDILSAPEPKWRLDAPVLALPAQEVTVPPGGEAVVTLQTPVAGKLKSWSPDAPNLYGLVVSVSADGADLDRQYTRFGWRQFQIEGKNLLLNGKPIQLFSDLGHPFGPFVCSRRYVWADYKMIKEMGGNAVRPHANVLPRLWADLADEMGICVIDETAIFGSSINLNLKEPATWDRFAQHVDGFVVRDRNHPSVFGWSVGNEMFALFFKTPKDEAALEYDKLKDLTKRPAKLDPTRNWISVDGDKDLEGTLPVWSRHMGIGLPEDLPEGNDKPLMIGEHGGTYYAGPMHPDLQKMNGDRSVASYAPRNEALAIDLYRMLTQVAKPKLAFFSPSEMVWFGLEHLPFGYRTDERPPSLADGVFFPGYEENVPGVQIERLPPYVATLNPGFDPELPLFKPMAMYEAMKAALDPRGSQPSAWDKLPSVPPKPPQPAPTNALAVVAFAGDAAGPLFQSLASQGVPLVSADRPEASEAKLLVVDGETASSRPPLADAILGKGGLVWIFAKEKGSSLPRLGDLIPNSVTLTSRYATALVRGEADPALDAFTPGDLFFAGDQGDPRIAKAGLDLSQAKSARVLLSASNTDWSLFQRQPETAKCAAMLIYEHVKKPSGTVLAEVPQGGGRLWLSTLDPEAESTAAGVFWHQLWGNLGVKLGRPVAKWIVRPGRDGETLWRYVVAMPSADWNQPAFDDKDWASAPSGFGTHVAHGDAKTLWTTNDIWLRKSFPIESLPPFLHLLVHHDDDIEVYINGKRVFAETGSLTDYKNAPLDGAAHNALHTGNNVIAVHCHHVSGDQFIDVGLAGDNTRRTEHDLLLDGPPQ